MRASTRSLTAGTRLCVRAGALLEGRSATPLALLGLPEKVGQRHSECPSQRHDDRHAGASLAALDAADVVAMHAGL